MQLSRQEATGLSLNILATETKEEIVPFLFRFGFMRQFLSGSPGTLYWPDWPWTQKSACFLLSARIKATMPFKKYICIGVCVCVLICLFCGASSNPGACWGSSTHWITFPAPILPFLLWKKRWFYKDFAYNYEQCSQNWQYGELWGFLT